MHLDLWWYPALFATALVAGLVDAIAGGGGLLTIPVLLGTGMAPVDALGTNKLQASFGSGTATWHYAHGGAVDWKACRLGVAFTFVGAALGAWAVSRMPREVLQAIIPFMLGGILLYMLLRPRFGQEAHPARLPAGPFFAIAGLALGFYDGFFGPGTGSFWTAAILFALGWGILPATGATKVMNFTSNVVSLGVFIAGGHAHWIAGLTMAAGQAIGARIGARLALRRGAGLIRPVFLAIVALTVLKLAYDLARR